MIASWPMPVYTPLRTFACRTSMLSRSSNARINFNQWNISSSCSDASLNLVRLIGGMRALQIATKRRNHEAAARPRASDERQAGLSEIPVQQLRGIGAEPLVGDLGVYRSEIRVVVHVSGVVLERRVLRIRTQGGG